MTLFRHIAYIGGVIAPLWLPPSNAEDTRQLAIYESQTLKMTDNANGWKMEQEILSALEKFRTHPEDRRNAAKKIHTSIERGISQKAVLNLLGKPDRKALNYYLFYSSVLSILLDDEDRVVSLISDLAEDALQGDELDASHPKVAAASAEFKESLFNKQKPAMTLIPVIKKNMSRAEVKAFLGAPNAEIWEYDLDCSGSTPLSVAFDPDSKVTSVTL